LKAAKLVDPSSSFTGSGRELIFREYLIGRIDQYLQIIVLLIPLDFHESSAEFDLADVDCDK
jgi:hypothetical protein